MHDLLVGTLSIGIPSLAHSLLCHISACKFMLAPIDQGLDC